MPHTSKFIKKAITIDEQIDLLKKKGLIIEDEAACAHFLTNVSYYRAKWYFRAFQNPDNSFSEGVEFSKIKAAYLTDQRMRNLIAEAIERIEVAFRARIVYASCCTYDDVFWHTENEKIQEITRNRIKKRKNGSDCPFTHFDKRYLDTKNIDNEYPFWIISELFFFSDLSQIYTKSLSDDLKKAISKDFSINPFKMSSCLHSLTVLRNTVAHHDKIFNRKFAIKPKLPWIGSEENRFCKENLFINHYYIICHFLSIIHPGNSWKQRVDELLKKDSDISKGYGFEV